MADKIGTDLGEDLIGTEGDDLLDARGGDDRLYAKGGNDLLLGGEGNDLLDGMTGADTMFGGPGDDKYRVDNAGDVVSEETVSGVDDGGLDIVTSTVTYTLGAFLERLTLTGTAAIDGAGNDLGNRIIGNGGANILSGLGGADSLSGGDGNDTLIGGPGKDTLTGGTGSDTFQFGPADATSTDKVVDFTAEDWLGINASDYGLSEGNGLGRDGTGRLVLDPAYFATVSGSTNVQGTSAGHGQFVYNTTTRTLMWDPDGSVTTLPGIALATFNKGTALSADRFAIQPPDGNPPPPPPPPEPPSVAVANGTPNPQTEGSTAQISFTVTLSAPASEDVRLTYSTVNGTATAGSDFAGVSGGVATITAGSTSTTIKITLLDDDVAENAESFTLRLDSAQLATSGTGLTITDATGTGSIADNDSAQSEPSVVAIRDLRAIGSTDPSGLAYVPDTQTLFLSDSEVDEDPFFRSDNLFALQPDGTHAASFSLGSFTKEPTGLAYDTINHHLFISDDDTYKVFWVDPTKPTVKLGEFLTKPLGGTDPEDLAFNSTNGHLFIVNGIPRTIIETDNRGTQVFSSITLPTVIADPEALAYDERNDVFYVGGGFSANIWVVDRAGTILDVIDILSNYRNPVTDTRVRVKDLEFAPSSNPNDDPGDLNLYVADYGHSHVNDGRLFEIDLGADWLVA